MAAVLTAVLSFSDGKGENAEVARLERVVHVLELDVLRWMLSL